MGGRAVQVAGRVIGLVAAGAFALAAGLGALNLPIAPGPFSQDGPADVAGTPAPAFSLTTPDGARRTLAAWSGRPVVLAFLADRATPGQSPTLAVLLKAARRLSGTRVAFVGVNTNLLNVSRKAARSFLSGEPVPRGFVFLTGSRLALASVWHEYGVTVSVIGGQVAFTPAVYVIQPNGYEAAAFLVNQTGRQTGAEARRLLRSLRPLD